MRFKSTKFLLFIQTKSIPSMKLLVEVSERGLRNSTTYFYIGFCFDFTYSVKDSLALSPDFSMMVERIFSSSVLYGNIPDLENK